MPSRRRLRPAAIAVSLGLASVVALASPAGAQNAADPADKKRLADTVITAAKPLALAKGTLGGEGGAWLIARLRAADIVMIGESHGTGSIAEAAGMLVDALPTDRPLAYALEIGPAAARMQEPLLRGSPEHLETFMADPRHAISFPFLNLREEAALARKILARAGSKAGAFWGLDQEFATAAPLLLDRLGGQARTARQKAAVAAARAKMTPLMALTSATDGDYDALDAAFANGSSETKKLLADMRLSSQIYRLQDSASNQSNRTREDYMKRNFLAYWREAGTVKPRVVMKFGAYHLTAGLSPTSTPALGGFVNALALIEGKTRLSVMILCGPDGQQIDFQGKINPCTQDFEETGSLFRERLFRDSATLIDTAPLRLIPGTLARMAVSEDIRSYIQSYDAIIILRGGKAATPFAPPPASYFTDN